jgi:hypothetical protein
MSHAGTMSVASDRAAIEDNAAGWSNQGAMLQHLEDDISHAKRRIPCPTSAGFAPVADTMLTSACGAFEDDDG